jgi:hypothetical protein
MLAASGSARPRRAIHGALSAKIEMNHSIDWYTLFYWVVGRVEAVAATIGVTGAGVGLVKVLRHSPAPRQGSLWAGCLFDTFQDLASNDTRIGERRPDVREATPPEAEKRL